VLGQPCVAVASDTTYLAVITYPGPNTIIAEVSNSANPSKPLPQAVDKGSGNVLWIVTEQRTSAFSDANGTLFAFAPNTNHIVALNGLTGTQLWRQHFDPSNFPLATMLLGDDGNLYVSAGASLYKTMP